METLNLFFSLHQIFLRVLNCNVVILRFPGWLLLKKYWSLICNLRLWLRVVLRLGLILRLLRLWVGLWLVLWELGLDSRLWREVWVILRLMGLICLLKLLTRLWVVIRHIVRSILGKVLARIRLIMIILVEVRISLWLDVTHLLEVNWILFFLSFFFGSKWITSHWDFSSFESLHNRACFVHRVFSTFLPLGSQLAKQT